MINLSNRVHLFARPESREKLIESFSTIFDCEVRVSSDAPGLPTSVVAFVFPNGAVLSVEFTEDALDDQQALHGAYLELEVDNPSQLQKKILAAGLCKVEYIGNDYFYFQAPGGQVLRVAPSTS